MERFAERWLSSRLLVLALFTAIYTAITAYLASLKLLWDDEFFTLYITNAPGWSGILDALSTGADQHPPSFYFIVQALTGAFGVGHITVRLSAIVGYWLFCVCTYEIASRLTNRVWGTLGLLLPMASPALYYATEARGYGMAVGFTAIAFLSWLLACEGTRRTVTVPLIALGLATAVGSHYYAGLIVAPLVLGEAVRSYLRRKLDIPVILSFAGVFVPIVAFLPLIRQARGYSQHFWAKPAWMDMVGFFPVFEADWLSIMFTGLFVLLLLGSKTASQEYRDVAVWKTAAFAMLAILPAVYLLIGKLITNSYTHRYALPALIGCVVLFCAGFARMARYRTAVALAMLLVTCGFSLVRATALRNTFVGARKDTATEVQFLRQSDEPIILVGEVTVFHRLSFYAPRELVRRLAYPADPRVSIRYQKHDTVDRGLLDLSPWFPINAVPFRDFLLKHRSFGAYGYVGPWSWLTFELPEVASEAKLLKRYGTRLLFHVEGIDAEQVVRRTSGYSGVTNRRPLYAQQPSTGPSLCSLWMGGAFCPDLR